MKVLFLCTGNSCRSQIAEGYGHYFGENFLEVKSAGTEPHGVNPRAIQTMKEDGFDISKQQSTKLTGEMLQWADIVITLCGDADERCPMLPPGKQKRHWPFEDPAKATGSEAQIAAKFREIRDGIKHRVQDLALEFKPVSRLTC